MAQRKPEYSPTTGTLSGESFEEQTVEMFKAANSLQRGQQKPSFALKGDIWAKENASGEFLGIYEVQDPTSELDGNLLFGAQATDEQMESLTPEQLALYSANAGQVKSLANDIDEKIVNKMEKDFSNATQPYLTETWKADDGSLWYRKYSDGFIEQGGSIEDTQREVTITFPVQFSNNKYVALKNYHSSTTSGAQYNVVNMYEQTTTTVKTYQGNLTGSWEAKGY